MSKSDFEVCNILKGEEQVEFKKSICAGLEFSALQILLTSQCSSAVLNEVHLFS